MTISQELQDIIDRQPAPGRRRRHPVTQWLGTNWLAVAMFLAWAGGQFLTGDRWVQAQGRTNAQLELEVKAVRAELSAAATTYVRQDVFTAWARGFEQQLTAQSEQLRSINSKLDGRQ